MGVLAFLLPLALGGAAGAISPSGPTVPANLLRFEVRFDHPMPGLSAQAIVLRDGAGAPIRDALLDIALPGRDSRTLVVLMQPGRIKHGVGPNLAVGSSLHEGEHITLEIADARRARPLVRSWRVAAPAAGRLDLADWRVAAPAPHSRAPLVVRLPTAINGSAADLIAIAGADGSRIAGTASLQEGETAWRFVPSAPWRAGSYRLRVHPDLEDPAGNRMCAPFELTRQSEVACGAEGGIDFRIGAR